MRRRTVLQLPLLAGTAINQALKAAERQLEPQFDLPGSLRFGVMGDSGSGKSGQLRVASRMRNWHSKQPWEFVAMMGDNIYENGEPKYFDSKFVDVYRDMLDEGVPFRATLGNHDVRYRDGRDMVQEEAFGFVGRKPEYEFFAGPKLMDGKRLARFICLNTNDWIDAIDGQDRKTQDRLVGSLRERLRDADKSHWNIFYFHQPIYSFVKLALLGIIPRGHGGSEALKQVLEPEIREYADLVMAGHDHFYQKIRPQHGVHHLISGAAGKLRKGADNSNPQVESGYQEFHFMDFSVGEDSLHYQAINDLGQRIHSGRIDKRGARRLVDIIG
jgi:hypothetical protein